MNSIARFAYKCGSGHIALNLSVALPDMPVAGLEKIIRLAATDFACDNDEDLRKLFRYIPDVEASFLEARHKAAEELDSYREARESQGRAVADRTERNLLEQLRKAESRYSRFMKKVPKLLKLKEKYRIGD